MMKIQQSKSKGKLNNYKIRKLTLNGTRGNPLVKYRKKIMQHIKKKSKKEMKRENNKKGTFKLTTFPLLIRNN